MRLCALSHVRYPCGTINPKPNRFSTCCSTSALSHYTGHIAAPYNSVGFCTMPGFHKAALYFLFLSRSKISRYILNLQPWVKVSVELNPTICVGSCLNPLIGADGLHLQVQIIIAEYRRYKVAITLQHAMGLFNIKICPAETTILTWQQFTGSGALRLFYRFIWSTHASSRWYNPSRNKN